MDYQERGTGVSSCHCISMFLRVHEIMPTDQNKMQRRLSPPGGAKSPKPRERLLFLSMKDAR